MRYLKYSTLLSYFSRILIFSLSLFYIILFSILQICKFNNFEPSCYLVGWISYSAWNLFAHGSFQILPAILPKLSIFFLFMPLNLFCFFLPPAPEILLILQNIIIMLTVIPLYLLANYLLKSRALAFALSLTFLLNPIIHFASISGFTLEIVALPSLMFAFYYLEKGNLNKAFVFVILASMCRISVLIMNLLWGLCIFFTGKNRKFGKDVFLVNFIWLLSSLIIFFFLKQHPILRELFHLEQYGDNLQGVIQKLLNSPSILLDHALNRENLYILLNISLPLAFTPLLRPIILLPLVFSFTYILFLHNNTPELCFILPFIYLSAIYGAKKIIAWKPNKQKLKYTLTVSLIVLSLISHYYLHLPWHSPIPFSKDANWGYYRLTKHNEVGHKFLKLIPQEASVLAQHPLEQYLYRRTKLDMLTRGSTEKDWEYIFLDTSAPPNYLTPPDYKSIVRRLLENNLFQVLARRDGWLLLKRTQSEQ